MFELRFCRGSTKRIATRELHYPFAEFHAGCTITHLTCFPNLLFRLVFYHFSVPARSMQLSLRTCRVGT